MGSHHLTAGPLPEAVRPLLLPLVKPASGASATAPPLPLMASSRQAMRHLSGPVSGTLAYTQLTHTPLTRTHALTRTHTPLTRTCTRPYRHPLTTHTPLTCTHTHPHRMHTHTYAAHACTRTPYTHTHHTHTPRHTSTRHTHTLSLGGWFCRLPFGHFA